MNNKLRELVLKSNIDSYSVVESKLFYTIYADQLYIGYIVKRNNALILEQMDESTYADFSAKFDIIQFSYNIISDTVPNYMMPRFNEKNYKNGIYVRGKPKVHYYPTDDYESCSYIGVISDYSNINIKFNTEFICMQDNCSDEKMIKFASSVINGQYSKNDLPRFFIFCSPGSFKLYDGIGITEHKGDWELYIGNYYLDLYRYSNTKSAKLI